MGKLVSSLKMNPILVKEFRGRMRTWRTSILLLLYLLIMGGMVLGYIYMRYANRSFFRPGESKELFMLVAVLQLILIGFVAPGLTAGAISGERERQTLNILLTTHLSPWKIVLSKLAASLSFITLLVFATLPLYAIVFLYGGVSPWQVVSVFGYYLLAMVLFGSIGMFCSAWFKRTGVSTVVAYGISLFILGGTALMAVFLNEFIMMRMARMYNGMQIPPHPQIYYATALNPVMNLLGLFEPDVLMMGQGMSANGAPIGVPIAPWLYLLIVYVPISAALIYFSVRMLTPVKKRRAASKAEAAR